VEKISLLVNCVFVFSQCVSDPPLCLGSQSRLPYPIYSWCMLIELYKGARRPAHLKGSWVGWQEDSGSQDSSEVGLNCAQKAEVYCAH
jgi:hypothetical protein